MCRASPLRAAGTPVAGRRRARAEEDLPGAKRGPGVRPQGGEQEGEGEEHMSPFAPARPFRCPLDPDARFTGRQVRPSVACSRSHLMLFSQVRALVEGAVRDRERELREEYDGLLADRLDEQWRTFAKFNEAQLHNQLEKSTFDYYC